MKRLSFLMMAGIMWLSSICGCSVKEDREDCPCRLFLDMAGTDMTAMSPLALYVSSDDGPVCEAVLADPVETYVVEVPRTGLSVQVWSGGGNMVSQQGLTIPVGSDCPRIYMHSSSVVANGDYVRDTVVLRKNYCMLTMLFSEMESPYALVLSGEVAGYDQTGAPRPGKFQVPVPVDTAMSASTQVCLPRQNGGELLLEIADGSGNIKTFPLHKYIAAVGYDWAEPDLKDLKLTLDYTMTAVTLVIQGWDEEFVFDIVI